MDRSCRMIQLLQNQNMLLETTFRNKERSYLTDEQNVKASKDKNYRLLLKAIRNVPESPFPLHIFAIFSSLTYMLQHEETKNIRQIVTTATECFNFIIPETYEFNKDVLAVEINIETLDRKKETSV